MGEVSESGSGAAWGARGGTMGLLLDWRGQGSFGSFTLTRCFDRTKTYVPGQNRPATSTFTMYTPELIITVLENAVFCESVERNRSAHRSTTNQQIVLAWPWSNRSFALPVSSSPVRTLLRNVRTKPKRDAP